MRYFVAFTILLLAAVMCEARDSCAGISSEIAAAEKALADGKPDLAEGILMPLQHSSGSCDEIVLLLGRTRLAQGMPALTRTLLTDYAQRVPSDAAGQLALAELLVQQRDFEGAEKCLATALHLRPNSIEGLLLQARLLQAQHRDEEAERVLRRACELNPNDKDCRWQLAVFLDAHHKTSEAADAFRKVVQADPGNASAWDYLALDLEAQGEGAQAEAAYTAGIQVNGGARVDRFLDYNYGRFLMKWNRLKESEVWLNRAAELAPDTRAVFYERAKLYLLLAKYPEARADAEHALHTADPSQYIQEVQIYALLSSVYQHLGDTQQAHDFAMLARATKLNGGSGDRR